MKDNITTYKNIKDFLQIDVLRFGEHDILIAFDQLDTKNFINHWASPLYIYVSALKINTEEIPKAIKAHHRDIFNDGRGLWKKLRESIMTPIA